MEKAKTALAEEWRANGKQTLYERLEPHLEDRGEKGSTKEMAQALGLSEGATRVAIHRLRQRFGELLRAQAADTLANPGDVEKEIRALFTAWSAAQLFAQVFSY